MKSSSGDRGPNNSPMRSAFQRRQGIVGSVILIVGAAALVGWLVVELYVAVVTFD